HGIYAQALSFNGTSSLVQIADANNLDFTTGMTLEAWVKPNTVNGWQTVVLKQGPQGLVYALYASDSAQHPAGFARISNFDRDARSPDPLPTNAWSHLVVTYEKAEGVVRIFVDGIPRDERLITGDIQVSANPMFIGGN